MEIELTKLEKDIIKKLASNENYNSIATDLKVSPSRIGNIMTRVYDKLRLRGIAGLTHWAIQNKLVKLGDFER